MKTLNEYIPIDPREGQTICCYRYLASHWIESLRNAELKTSGVSEFNDIFDGRGGVVGKIKPELIANHIEHFPVWEALGIDENEIKQVINGRNYSDFAQVCSEVIRKAVLTRGFVYDSRLVCFSETDDSDAIALMWSHYANHWKGVRLCFNLLYEMHKEINFKFATSPFVIDHVRYTYERPLLDLSLIESFDDAYLTAYYRRLLMTKSPAWKYEHEWRMLVQNQAAEERMVNGRRMFFWKFHKRLLSLVDIGPAMPEGQQSELVSLLRSEYPHVKIRKGVLNQQNYKIDYEVVA